MWEGEYVVRVPLKIIIEINRFLDGYRIETLLGDQRRQVTSEKALVEGTDL